MRKILTIAFLFLCIIAVLAQPISDEDGGVTTVLLPEGGGYYQASNAIPGAIKIQLPLYYSNSFIKIWVDVYNYETNESSTMLLSGYSYLGTTDWRNCSAQIITSSRDQGHKVYFGDDGSKCAIWIGENDTVWRYLGVRVVKVQATHGGSTIDNWDDGWNVSPDPTDFKGIHGPLFSITNTLPYSPWIHDSNGIRSRDENVGIGVGSHEKVGLNVGIAANANSVSNNGIVVNQNTLTTQNTTSYDKALSSNLAYYSIPAGITDLGYKIAVEGNTSANNDLFAGTLNTTIGSWNRTGIYKSALSGKINNAKAVWAEILARDGEIDEAYGVYISTSQTDGIINKHYDLFASSPNANNYFAGNVGVGTKNPGMWKLAVNGKIRAKEIKVETNWSDFVFEKEYNLPTLEEVENHIKEKGHLKDIPSATEVEENGILLGEMDAKLLQKIEELTLYQIEANKLIQELRKELDLLKKANDIKE